MIDHLGATLNAALAVVAIATLAGLGLMRGTVTGLRENLSEARAEIGDKERRLKDAEAEIIKLKAQTRSQAHDLDAVGRLVRGESYWTELGDKLDIHHTEAKTHWAEDERLLARILADLDALDALVRQETT